MLIQIRSLVLLAALIISLAFLGACSDPEGIHAPTNGYSTAGTFIIKGNPGTAFEFNEYSFFIRLEDTNFEDTRKITFLLSGLSRNSHPNVRALLAQAKLIIGEKILSPYDKVEVAMKGDVNDRNGETLFHEIKISFPYDPELHWGKKIMTQEMRDALTKITGFVLVIPVSVPVYDRQPRYDDIGRTEKYAMHTVTFQYRRDERPGEPYFRFGSW
jgi:hypothetical protein